MSPGGHSISTIGRITPLLKGVIRTWLRCWGCRPYKKRFTMIVSFCPPKPKLFDNATSTFAGRALFGT